MNFLPFFSMFRGADAAMSTPAHVLLDKEESCLLERAQQGSSAAFETLIGPYQGAIFCYLRAFTDDANEAADVTQDALVQIYRFLPEFRHESSLRSWMFKIARSVCLDSSKGRWRHERKSELPGDEQMRAIWKALATLSPTNRAVVVMADMQGLSHDEIAFVVEAPVEAVKLQLRHGREAMRVALYGT